MAQLAPRAGWRGILRLPSGWTPIELVKHLIFMERRWLVWGFQGEELLVGQVGE